MPPGKVRSSARFPDRSRQAHRPQPIAPACHMPKRRAEDTPRMVMTDHLIQRRPPAGDLLAECRSGRPRIIAEKSCPTTLSPSPKRARTLCTAPWRRWDWEIIRGRLAGTGARDRRSRSRARPSSISCSATPGRQPENTTRSHRSLRTGSSTAAGFGEGVCGRWRPRCRTPGNPRRPSEILQTGDSTRACRPRAPGIGSEYWIPAQDASPKPSIRFSKAIALDPSLAGEVAEARRDPAEGRTARSRPGCLA